MSRVRCAHPAVGGRVRRRWRGAACAPRQVLVARSPGRGVAQRRACGCLQLAAARLQPHVVRVQLVGLRAGRSGCIDAEGQGTQTALQQEGLLVEGHRRHTRKCRALAGATQTRRIAFCATPAPAAPRRSSLPAHARLRLVRHISWLPLHTPPASSEHLASAHAPPGSARHDLGPRRAPPPRSPRAPRRASGACAAPTGGW
jgi:hypothetical protein